MKEIRVLDKETASKIAAGEVIERPVSVVKELVENSLDAGATQISVKIQDGGISAIVVIDNGCGIAEDYVELAFVRHATSKIKHIEDLSRIHTLGFRGEALPSIACVSKVTMITRTSDQQAGVKIEIANGEVQSRVPAGCNVGTKVVVEDLFCNIPARKKHLKKRTTEAALISDVLSRLALSRPDVKFKLISQGRTVLHTPGSGKLIEAIASISGIEVAEKMIEICANSDSVKVYGYIGKPELLRPNRAQQTVIVNGRYVKSELISNALKQAYDTMLPSKYHPVAVLNIDIKSELVDVNVHPAKLRVRFDNEGEIYELILNAVKKALRYADCVPVVRELSFPSARLVNAPGKLKQKDDQAFQQKFEFDDRAGISKESSFFRTCDKGFAAAEEKAQFYCFERERENEDNNTSKIEEKAYGDNGFAEEQLSRKGCSAFQNIDILPEIDNNFPDMWPIAQLMPTYILAQSNDGLYIIDQHAAHERVLYEKYLKSNEEHNSQTLLVPVVLNLNFDEAEILRQNILVFKKLGFILEYFGECSYLLRGVPVGFPAGEEAQFFLEVLNNASKHKGNRCEDVIKSDTFFEHLASMLACKSAIKAGQRLSKLEMESLIEDMRRLDNPYTCPHGRPTVISLSYAELERRFKR